MWPKFLISSLIFSLFLPRSLVLNNRTFISSSFSDISLFLPPPVWLRVCRSLASVGTVICCDYRDSVVWLTNITFARLSFHLRRSQQKLPTSCRQLEILDHPKNIQPKINVKIVGGGECRIVWNWPTDIQRGRRRTIYRVC